HVDLEQGRAGRVAGHRRWRQRVDLVLGGRAGEQAGAGAAVHADEHVVRDVGDATLLVAVVVPGDDDAAAGRHQCRVVGIGAPRGRAVGGRRVPRAAGIVADRHADVVVDARQVRGVVGPGDVDVR